MTEIKRYPYIVAFGKMMGHQKYYIANVIKQARKEDAPPTAIYRRAVGTWCLLEDCNRETRRMIKSLLMEG